MALTLGAYTQNPCSKLELARELHCIPPPSLSHIGKEIPNFFDWQSIGITSSQ
jgi:hypothetical protein